MKEIASQLLGLDQGTLMLFSDFQQGGPMWSGTGAREVRRRVSFAAKFRNPPAVIAGVGMWDADTSVNLRADLSTENVNAGGFDLVFRTWGDSRIARIRAEWTAIGELAGPDDWDV